MAAHPETIRTVQAIHDTVRDTIVRVAAAEHSGTSPLLVAAITAAAAVVAGVAAQWFRVWLDVNRRREQVRQVLLLEAPIITAYLDKVEKLARRRAIPGREFWAQVDSAMRGYDQLHTDLVLLPNHVRVRTVLWYTAVRAMGMVSESFRQEYESEGSPQGDARRERLHRDLDNVARTAANERLEGEAVYRMVSDSVPKWNQILGSGFKRRDATLDRAMAAVGKVRSAVEE